MNQKDWQKKGAGHRQRLRDKFLALGMEAFSDSEALELLLTMGTPRKDCKATARAAISQFGSFTAVLEASQQELQTVPGMGPNNVFALHFLHGISRRYLKKRLQKKQYLHSSQEVAAYLSHSMRDLTIEAFQVILLDAAHAIIDTKILAEGSLASNTIYPRELVKLALTHHAGAVIVAHNHPSGALNPSEADLKVTKALFIACHSVGIKLLDHFIIGQEEQPFSFADNGIMTSIHKQCSDLF